jgi:hypothetical protein
MRSKGSRSGSGQGARPLTVLDCHGQPLKALASDAAGDVGGDKGARRFSRDEMHER